MIAKIIRLSLSSFAIFSLLVCLVSTTWAKPDVAASSLGYPASIASSGDSITRAFNSDTSNPLQDVPANSWATGSNPAVNSHYLRILSANPSISGKSYNFAQSGTKMSALQNQLASAAAQQPEYLTILMGANDICSAADQSQITSIADFTTQFRAALTSFSQGSPDSRIFVASIVDLQHLWQILHTNPAAQFIWNNAPVCPMMLYDSGNDAVDAARRDQVEQILLGYNQALQTVCAEFIHCRFDNNVTFNTAFTPADVSSLDYFHPSLQGQATLAAGTWATTFNFSDIIPPVSKVSLSSDYTSGQTTLTLTASDDKGVSGIEYKLNGDNWTKYSAPLVLNSTTLTVSYRAVDLNGNNETSHTVRVVTNNGAIGSTGQTFFQALNQAQTGDTIAFALTGLPVQIANTASLSVNAGVRIDGGSCSGVTLQYVGAGRGTLTLSGKDNLYGLNLLNIDLQTHFPGTKVACTKVKRV